MDPVEGPGWPPRDLFLMVVGRREEERLLFEQTLYTRFASETFPR